MVAWEERWSAREANFSWKLKVFTLLGGSIEVGLVHLKQITRLSFSRLAAAFTVSTSSPQLNILRGIFYLVQRGFVIHQLEFQLLSFFRNFFFRKQNWKVWKQKCFLKCVCFGSFKCVQWNRNIKYFQKDSPLNFFL